jgi:hypothetical protein
MDSLARIGVKVPVEIQDWAKKEGNITFESYKTKCNAISFKYNELEHSIVILGSENAIRKAKLLIDTVFSHARDLKKIHDNKAKKDHYLQKVKEKLDTEIRIEFKVPSECVGLLVGSQ